jgi:hypothetical protein
MDPLDWFCRTSRAQVDWHHAARSTRWRSRSNLARPYPCRLNTVMRFTCPSIGPTEYVAYCTSSHVWTSCSGTTCSAPTARAPVRRLKQTGSSVIVPRALDVSSTIPPPDGRLLHLQPSGQLLTRQHAGFPQPRVAALQSMMPPQLRDMHSLKRQPSEGLISLAVQLLSNLRIG